MKLYILIQLRIKFKIKYKLMQAYKEMMDPAL